MTNEQLAVVVAFAALVPITVGLSVVACERRDRQRKAKEAVAMRRRFDAYLIAEKEKTDRYIQSLSPELQEKWARDKEALKVKCDLYASAPSTGPAQRAP